jgi:REP element-mobilizing transposase RayT
MSRGNRQEAIFQDDKDCETFLDTLEEACTRTGWRVHAFVLMGNHYHLLLETPEANLVAGMKWLQGTYTQRFNARHKLWGHLLQGRYKALLVDGSEDGYFSAVGNYIHLNPARARLFDAASTSLAEWRWSSYPLYLRPSRRPAWLDVERLLGCLGVSDSASGRRRFWKYMNKRVQEVAFSDNPTAVDESWARIRRGWCFGGEAFRDEMLERIESLSGKRESFSGAPVQLHDEQEAAKLVVEGLKVLGLREEQLQAMSKGADEKALLAWLVRRNSVVTNAWIAERLGMGRPDCLSRYPRRVENSRNAHIVEMKEKLIAITRLRD